MKFKFRYEHDGQIAFKEIDLPDDAKRLVGYDSKRREVYEGDKLVDKLGEEYVAQWTRTLREGEGGIYSQPTERFWADRARYTPLTLKEGS